jgi:hypothetical protein
MAPLADSFNPEGITAIGHGGAMSQTSTISSKKNRKGRFAVRTKRSMRATTLSRGSKKEKSETKTGHTIPTSNGYRTGPKAPTNGGTKGMDTDKKVRRIRNSL